MWIQGRRRGGGKDLSNYLQKTDENEVVHIREMEGFLFEGPTGTNLDKALLQMEAVGCGKRDKRNLYHVILAPAYGEALNAQQRQQMVAYYVEKMGFKNHQYALVEHWKKGKQHFHLVFNMINPVTSKTHALKWNTYIEWQISRDLEQMFGFKTFQPQGKAARMWEMQRGKRTGLDPRKLRKEVTAIYHVSMTADDFVTLLEKNGLTLTRGRENRLVLVDQYGDTHGLMRLIEGKTLANLRRKFPELETMSFRSHADLVGERKTTKPKHHTKRRRSFIHPRDVRREVRKAYRRHNTGSGFVAGLNKHGYQLGRSRKGYAVIDRNGDQYDLTNLLGKQTFKDLSKVFPDFNKKHLQPASTIIRRLKVQRPRRTGSVTGKAGGDAAQITTSPIQASRGNNAVGLGSSATADAVKTQFRHTALKTKNRPKQNKELEPTLQPAPIKGWPPEAVADWASWGHKDRPAFFRKWPDLSAG